MKSVYILLIIAWSLVVLMHVVHMVAGPQKDDVKTLRISCIIMAVCLIVDNAGHL